MCKASTRGIMNLKKIGLIEAISIGIGGMVGGGIFAVLGLAVSLAQGGTPVAFLIAGIIALLTAISYSKLSLSYPSGGGTVKFMNIGFGVGIFSGGLNNLLWISYIIMLSLYATAFGSYAPKLIPITGNDLYDSHIFTSLIIIIATFINYYSTKVVSRIESYAVIIKLFILLTFVVVGIYGLIGNENLHQLSFSNWGSPLTLITAGMVIFVAYEGFELIANAALEIENPKVNIPKAYIYSVVFVIGLYLAISIITVGTLPFSEIAIAEEYVLAEAAKPIVGQVGFTIITIAALISTFSAINASLYGGARVSYEIALEGEAPHELTSCLWNQPLGLMVTSVLTLIIANSLKLQSISIAGSIGFLIIFAMVNYISFKKSTEIQSNKTLALISTLLCIIAVIALVIQQVETNLIGVIIALGIVTFSFTFEYVFKKFF